MRAAAACCAQYFRRSKSSCRHHRHGWRRTRQVGKDNLVDAVGARKCKLEHPIAPHYSDAAKVEARSATYCTATNLRHPYRLSQWSASLSLSQLSVARVLRGQVINGEMQWRECYL